MTEQSSTEYFKVPELKYPHEFLCEELLVPRAECADAQRLNMYSNHLNQRVELVNPELPRVFTRFENQFGNYSISKRLAKKDFKVIKKIIKNKYNYDFLIQYSDGVYDILHYHEAVNISESYGYRMNDKLQDKTEVKENEQVFMSDNYDENNNYSYGTNLKALYASYKSRTFEDGIVLTESGAKKLKSWKVEESLVSINANDILLNLYGDDKVYKSIPQVGDEIHNRVLLASRRVDYRKTLYDLNDISLKTIDNISDDITYTCGGKISDISIYPNISLEALEAKENAFTKELIELYKNEKRYYEELAVALETVIPKKVLTEKEIKELGDYLRAIPVSKDENKNKYTDELGYCWKYAHEWLDQNIQWRYDGKSFENVKIKFTILKENPITVGCKITGRYGNKGVVTEIIPDTEAPVNQYGEKVEIILNPLGVINRLNPAQIQEQYLNFMGANLIRLVRQESDIEKKFNLIYRFYGYVAKEEEAELRNFVNNLSDFEKEEFIKELEEKGLYIHQHPFFGNIDLDGFSNIYKEWPEICELYKCNGIERPLVFGDVYFIRLKHEPSNKSSIRSTSLTNIKNLPSKSTLKKQNKSLFSTTPIRLGEMEVSNLSISEHPEIVEKLLKSYATSDNDREQLVEELLTAKNPFNIDYELSGEHSIPRQILDKYLAVLELELKD